MYSDSKFAILKDFCQTRKHVNSSKYYFSKCWDSFLWQSQFNYLVILTLNIIRVIVDPFFYGSIIFFNSLISLSNDKKNLMITLKITLKQLEMSFQLSHNRRGQFFYCLPAKDHLKELLTLFKVCGISSRCQCTHC